MRITKKKLKEIIKEEIQKLNEGSKLKKPKTAEEARDQAADWQNEFSKKSLSWGEVLAAQHHFETQGKKFKLTKEFQENGII